jgi:hypothetical protein
MVQAKFRILVPNPMYSRFFPNLLLASGLDGSLGTMAGVRWVFCERRCSSGMVTLDFIVKSGRGIGGRLLTCKTATSSRSAVLLPYFPSSNSLDCGRIALVTKLQDRVTERERRRESQGA